MSRYVMREIYVGHSGRYFDIYIQYIAQKDFHNFGAEVFQELAELWLDCHADFQEGVDGNLGLHDGFWQDKSIGLYEVLGFLWGGFFVEKNEWDVAHGLEHSVEVQNVLRESIAEYHIICHGWRRKKNDFLGF